MDSPDSIIKRKARMNIIIYCFLAIFTIISCLIVWKLYETQIVEGETHRDAVERNFVRPVTVAPLRGSIFFTNKDDRSVLGAISQDGFLLGANPNKIKDKDEVYKQLTSIIKLDNTLYKEKINIDLPFVILKHNITISEAEKIKAEKIKGIQLRKNRIREYPWDETGSHIIGFSREAEQLPRGEYGLEKYYNSILSETNGESEVSPFADILLDIGEDIDKEHPSDIITTIDIWTQILLEEELEKIQNEWNSDKTAGIIMDPKTGAVLAMGAFPTFNPNEYAKEKDFSVFLNPLVEEIYEFGSIMKPLTIAIGLDSGEVEEDFTYNDFTGSVELGEFTIHNFDEEGRGANIGIQDILSNSLNTGIYALVREFGIENMKKYLEKLELGKETGIDLPNEIQGKITNVLESPRLVESVTAGYGQGIALTPIGAIRALATLANKGNLVSPHIVSSIINDGEEKKAGRSGLEQEKVFQDSIADEVTELLVNVVDDALLGGTVKKERYSIAAKTGTALLVNPKTKGYYDDKFLHSFFGYFPASDPKFIIFLYTSNPKGVKYASQSLTEPFIRVVDSLIDYHNITPDR